MNLRDVLNQLNNFDEVIQIEYSGAAVERFLGINTSAVNSLVVSDELAEGAKTIKMVLEPRLSLFPSQGCLTSTIFFLREF